MHHFNAAITTAITAATQPRAAGARLPRVPAQRGGRRREGPGARVRAGARATIRRAPTGWRAIWRRRASRCGAPTEPLTVGDAHGAGRRLPRVARAAGRPAGAQPARPRTSPQPDDVHRPAGGAARSAGSRDQIYDITAWSLPLVFDVEVRDERHGASATRRRRCRRPTTRRPRPRAAGRRQGRLPRAVGRRRPRR